MQPICLGSAQFLEASSKWVVGLFGFALFALFCCVKLFSLPPFEGSSFPLGGVLASETVD